MASPARADLIRSLGHRRHRRDQLRQPGRVRARRAAGGADRRGADLGVHRRPSGRSRPRALLRPGARRAGSARGRRADPLALGDGEAPVRCPRQSRGRALQPHRRHAAPPPRGRAPHAARRGGGAGPVRRAADRRGRARPDPLLGRGLDRRPVRRPPGHRGPGRPRPQRGRVAGDRRRARRLLSGALEGALRAHPSARRPGRRSTPTRPSASATSPASGSTGPARSRAPRPPAASPACRSAGGAGCLAVCHTEANGVSDEELELLEAVARLLTKRWPASSRRRATLRNPR